MQTLAAIINNKVFSCHIVVFVLKNFQGMDWLWSLIGVTLASSANPLPLFTTHALGNDMPHFR